MMCTVGEVLKELLDLFRRYLKSSPARDFLSRSTGKGREPKVPLALSNK